MLSTISAGCIVIGWLRDRLCEIPFHDTLLGRFFRLPVLLLLQLLLTAGIHMPCSRLEMRPRRPVKELLDAPKSSLDQLCDLQLQGRPNPRPRHLVVHFLESLFIPSASRHIALS